MIHRLAPTLLLLLFAASLYGQRFKPVYHAVKTTTMSGTAEVVTITNPTSGGRQVNIKAAFVRCSAACDFQVEMDGSAATGTAITPAKATKRLGNSIVNAVSASTSTAPRFSIPYSLPSAGSYPLLFNADYSLPGDGTASNFTVRMVTATGITVTIFIQWEEP